jgi:flavin reductase (DIM6/NTAB) family NADH-FMN oxidoreductase RutF
MKLPWNDPRSNKFATSIGIITSNGPNGHNIMACEWTHHLSYDPGLVAISIGPTKTTVENIRTSKEFGVNLCASDQSILSSVAGGYTGAKYDKVNALKELGFEFYKAKKIIPPMVKGAAVNIECRLYKEITLGDHITFVGEVVEASNNPDKVPLAYHGGKYWIMDTNLVKPSMEERERIKNVVEKYSR